jgi:hypothetical protein
MMLDMAGKRLVAAGMFAATVAAAALWAMPKTPPAIHSTLFRHMRATVATMPATQVDLTAAKSALQSAAHSPVAWSVTRGILFGLTLLGLVLLWQRQSTPVVARLPRRGRSPPPPRAQHHTAPPRWR